MSAPSPCKACGAQIVFAMGRNGKRIPLQRVRKLYRYAPNRMDGIEAVELVPGELGAERGDAYYVSHFETCTDPGRFSGRKR